MGNVSVRNELSSRPERSVVEGPAVHSISTQLNRKLRFVHRERTRISCHAELDEAARAPFSKEKRMKFADATRFHSKSGEGLGTNPRPNPSGGGAALNIHFSLTHSRESRRYRRQLRLRFVLWRPMACIAGAGEPIWRWVESAARPFRDPLTQRERFRPRRKSCFSFPESW